MAKKSKSRGKKPQKKPTSKQQSAGQKPKKKGIPWKRVFSVSALLALCYLALSWYNSPTNYVLRTPIYELIKDEVQYYHSDYYQHMAQRGKLDELDQRIRTDIEANGFTLDTTISDVLDDHPQITNFAIREIETFDMLEGKRVPVTVVSITFDEKNRYVFRLLEFGMYNPFFLPIPFHYDMISSAAVRSYKDEEGELHVRKGINPFEVLTDFNKDDFSPEGYLKLPEESAQ